jgi:hypothetical protein
MRKQESGAEVAFEETGVPRTVSEYQLISQALAGKRCPNVR